MPRKILIQKLWLVLLIFVSCSPALYGQSAADQYSIAAGFYSRGQWQEAISGFETLIFQHPKTEYAYEGYFFLGESQLQVSNYTYAKIAYQKFLINQPASKFAERASFRMAEVAYRSNDSQAATLLEVYMNDHRDSELVPFALSYLGEVRLKRGEPQLALQVFNTALKDYPESEMANSYRLGLGKALRMQNRNDEARNFFEYLVEHGGPEIQAEVQLQLGLIHFSESDWPTAIEYLQFVQRSEIEGQPAEGEDKKLGIEATYWIGRCYLEQGEPLAAIEQFKQLSPEQISEKLGPAVYFDGAVAWARTGRNAEALQWLQQIRVLWPQSEWADDALQLEIDIAQRDEQFDLSVQLSELFVENHSRSPLLPKVQESLGRIRYDRRDYAGAIALFSELLEKSPQSAKANDLHQRATWQYLVGLSYLGLKDYESAVAVLANIPVQSEKSFNSAVAIARATARSAVGDYQNAVVDYEAYLFDEPSGNEAARALSELAICQTELKNWTGANNTFAKLQANFPQSDYLSKTAVYIANSSYKAEELDTAVNMYHAMIGPENDPELIAKGLAGLAWVYHDRGDNERAEEYFERILSEFPDSNFAVDAAMARAKQLEDKSQFEAAARTYSLVSNTATRPELANVARLRIAHCKQKLGGANNLNAAKIALTDYLASESGKDNVDEAIYQLAWVYKDLQLESQGFSRFNEIATNYPDSKYWADAAYRVAENKFQNEQYNEAQSLVEELVRRADQKEILARAIFMNGQISAMNNQWQHVGDSMTALVERTDDKGIYAKANYWLAESLYQRKQYAASADIFGQLIEKTDLLDRKIWPWVALRYSQCRANSDQWADVGANSETAKQKFPQFSKNYEHDYLIGRSLEQVGRLDEARVRYLAVVDSKEGGSTETAAKAQWRIGETYFHQEEYENAIHAFYKVDSLFSYEEWRSAAIYEAGKCQEHLGHWKKAVILYQQLVNDFPECEFVDEAQKRLEFSNRRAAQTEDAEMQRR